MTQWKIGDKVKVISQGQTEKIGQVIEITPKGNVRIDCARNIFRPDGTMRRSFDKGTVRIVKVDDTPKSVYIIVSPNGGIAINLFTGKGTVYANREQAEEALKSKNNWAEAKGYGIYELVELEVKE